MRAHAGGLRVVGQLSAAPEGDVVPLAPRPLVATVRGRLLEESSRGRRDVRGAVGLFAAFVTEDEHGDRLVAVQEDEAGVDGSVGCVEHGTRAGPGALTQSVKHFAGGRCLPGSTFSKAEQCLPKEIRQELLLGHSASLTTATKRPARAAAAPFLVDSLLKTRAKYEGADGTRALVASDMVVPFAPRRAMFLQDAVQH